MIGIDTNVLLRVFIADDDRTQHERAIALISGLQMPIFVNAVVLAEATWTLAKRLKKPRADVVTFVEKVLGADVFDVMNAAAAQAALSMYRSGKAEFADYFIAEINAEAGCEKTATFDRDASCHPQYLLVP